MLGDNVDLGFFFFKIFGKFFEDDWESIKFVRWFVFDFCDVFKFWIMEWFYLNFVVLKLEVEYYDCIFSGSDSGLVNVYYLVLFDLYFVCFIFFELML